MSACVLPHAEPEQAEVGLLCARHRRRLDMLTREIRALWCEIALVIDGSTPREGTPKTRHLKAAEAPAPVDLTLAAMRDPRTKLFKIAPTEVNPDGDLSEPLLTVPPVVASWAYRLRDERGLTQIDHRLLIRLNRPVAITPVTVPMRVPVSLVAQLDFLQRHNDWWAANPDVDDYHDELDELRRALKSATHDHSHAKFGVCDMPVPGRAKCGGDLLQENGSGVIRCSACGCRWVTPQEQARLAVRQ